jgi:hypothetical protein
MGHCWTNSISAMRRFLFLTAAGVAMLIPTSLHAQGNGPTSEQLESWIAIRQQRVDLLRNEIKQIDSRIEARLDLIIESLTSIADTKDSRTKVTRIKEDTMKGMKKMIDYYDQKRAIIRQELRNPRSALTETDRRRIVDALDRRIEKRTQQILALNKSMPAHQDHERYTATGDGLYGTRYKRNEDYDQNRRLTSHSNTQRKAIVKELDSSIARLERMGRELRAQLAATTDPVQQKERTADIARNDALIAERKMQKVEALNPKQGGGSGVSIREATDLDKAVKSTAQETRRDFDALFQRYHSLISEGTALRMTQKTLAGKKLTRSL